MTVGRFFKTAKEKKDKKIIATTFKRLESRWMSGNCLNKQESEYRNLSPHKRNRETDCRILATLRKLRDQLYSKVKVGDFFRSFLDFFRLFKSW